MAGHGSPLHDLGLPRLEGSAFLSVEMSVHRGSAHGRSCSGSSARLISASTSPPGGSSTPSSPAAAPTSSHGRTSLQIRQPNRTPLRFELVWPVGARQASHRRHGGYEVAVPSGPRSAGWGSVRRVLRRGMSTCRRPSSRHHRGLPLTHRSREQARGSPTARRAMPRAAENPRSDTVCPGVHRSRLGESNPRPTHYECVALAD